MTGRSLYTLALVLVGVGTAAVIIGIFDVTRWFVWVAVALWLVSAVVFIAAVAQMQKEKRSRSAP